MALDNYLNLIRQLPDYVLLKDNQLNYVGSNDALATIVGFKNSDQLIGITDYDLPCQACEYAELFRKQDQIAIDKGDFTTFDYYTYTNGDRILLYVNKKRIIDPITNEVGVICVGKPVTSNSVMQFVSLLNESESKYHADMKQRCFSYQISQTCQIDNKHLSRRQAECVFYLLRGKTAREIAYILKLSPRTIEKYINHLKEKFKCNNKSQLINYLVDQNMMQYIPTNLLSNLVMA